MRRTAVNSTGSANEFGDRVVKGSCLCGGIEFEVQSHPRKIYQCHCSLCRKQSGGAANAAFIVLQERLTWLSGQERIRSYRRETGFRSDFCDRCGSPVPNRVGATRYVWVPAGLLDEPTDLQIALHLHMSSKADWEPQPSAVAAHCEMPSLNEILNILDQADT